MLARFAMPLDPISDPTTAHAMFAALQARAAAQGTPLLAPPPAPTTCCGRGCNGCVWEGWYAAVGWWREDALLALGD